mmetsp:Transcript_18636/g.71903  ORF Transcript_18636/g.71903 Transcript_18636/m.71903 type:complete len:443 (+) Transcript_18636:1548-2876(+)
MEHQVERVEHARLHLLPMYKVHAQQQQAHDRLLHQRLRLRRKLHQPRKVLVHQHPDEANAVLVAENDVGEEVEAEAGHVLVEVLVRLRICGLPPQCLDQVHQAVRLQHPGGVDEGLELARSDTLCGSCLCLGVLGRGLDDGLTAEPSAGEEAEHRAARAALLHLLRPALGLQCLEGLVVFHEVVGKTHGVQGSDAPQHVAPGLAEVVAVLGGNGEDGLGGELRAPVGAESGYCLLDGRRGRREEGGKLAEVRDGSVKEIAQRVVRSDGRAVAEASEEEGEAGLIQVVPHCREGGDNPLADDLEHVLVDVRAARPHELAPLARRTQQRRPPRRRHLSLWAVVVDFDLVLGDVEIVLAEELVGHGAGLLVGVAPHLDVLRDGHLILDLRIVGVHVEDDDRVAQHAGHVRVADVGIVRVVGHPPLREGVEDPLQCLALALEEERR